MIDSVLFVFCIIAAILAGIMHTCAIRHFDSVHCPVAQKIVRQCSNGSGLIVMLYIALWFIGTNLDGVLPAFGPMMMILFIIMSLALGWHNLSYARQHKPVIIGQQRTRQ